MHVLILIESETDIDTDSRRLAAESSIPDGKNYSLATTSRDVVLRLGLSACTAYRSSDASQAALIARLLGVHTVIWAAAVDFDRVLLREFAGSQRLDIPPLEVLEERADNLLSLYERVRAFSSRR
jgi:hypothetical protein